ncbi:hypothetical protein SAMN06272771_0123 [Streptomyces sp. Ag82_O1-12]|nr:hypothetical protein SAMN06272771_0123 [Streptomyces sp. Ag82_O1-12]SOD42876.1 hypothetical protein SAMN06272727_0113 [Streptomyces sp. Ag82_G6-1]
MTQVVGRRSLFRQVMSGWSGRAPWTADFISCFTAWTYCSGTWFPR